MTDAEFQTAFDQHKDAVYRFAWRMSGSAAAAEDITQDVFVGLLRYPDRFDPGRGTLRAFLLGIARNLALKRWRTEHRLEPLDDEALSRSPLTSGAARWATWSAGPCARCGRSNARSVILAEYEGLTLAEIARAVDADVGTVKSRLHRARENLRRTLAPLRSGQPTTT